MTHTSNAVLVEATSEEIASLSAPPNPGEVTIKLYNIPGDQVYQATAKLTDRERDAIRWLHAYATDQNLSQKDLAAQLKRKDGSSYDENTVYKVLTGRHEAKLTNFVEAVEDLRKFVEARGSVNQIPFIKTRLAERIWGVCDSARIFGRIQFIFGASQIGKSECLVAYQKAYNHGRTVYVCMPEGGTYREFLYELAGALNISTELPNLRRRIIKSFDARMVLIVDEAHQVFLSRSAQITTLEFVRLLADRSKCGVVICATEVFEEEILMGKAKGWLNQLNQRKLIKCKLPAKPIKDDLDTFSAAYGLKPAHGEALKLQNDIIAYEGLGQWLCVLRAASRMASSAKEKLTWTHVIKADAGLRKMAQGDL